MDFNLNIPILTYYLYHGNITFQNIKEVKLRKKQELRSMDLGTLLVKRTKTTEMIVILIVYY